jgi:hypothetical protein
MFRRPVKPLAAVFVDGSRACATRGRSMRPGASCTSELDDCER